MKILELPTGELIWFKKLCLLKKSAVVRSVNLSRTFCLANRGKKTGLVFAFVNPVVVPVFILDLPAVSRAFITFSGLLLFFAFSIEFYVCP